MGIVTILSPRDSDAATLVASSQVTALPVGNLQTMQPKKVWRTASGVTAFVTAALASAIACNGVSFVGVNWSATATIRVRGAASPAAVTAAPVVDTGVVSPWPATGKPTVALWPNYLGWRTWSNAVALQYWRIDIDDTGNAAGYIEAGRLALGAYWTPTTNFDLEGVPLAFDARDVRTTTPYGYSFTDRRAYSAPRRFSLKISAANVREVMDGIAEIQRLCGLWRDVVVILDPQLTTDFHRFSMQGLFENAPSFPQASQAWDGGGIQFGATLPMLELL